MVEGVPQCLQVLDGLVADPMRIRHVESRIERRRLEYAPEVVLGLWTQALLDASRAPETVGWRTGARTVRASGRADARHVETLVTGLSSPTAVASAVRRQATVPARSYPGAP